MKECLFCKIINNEIPSYTLYEDEIVKVFLDIDPKSNGHTLIIPKKHFLDLDDIDINVLKHILEVAKKIKIKLEEKLNPTGIVLIQNNGSVQEIKHYHLHLIPVYNDKKIDNIEDVYKKISD